MPVTAIIGGQWGDEGKGKVVDLLAQQAEVVVRFGGGSNAGHTVVNQLGTFRMHLIPSGIFNANALCIVGNGTVVDPKALLEETDDLQSRGVDLRGLRISDKAHVIMPYHRLQDRLEEAVKGQRAIGTTGRGIGPAYADKYARIGIRMGDLVDPSGFRARLEEVLPLKNRLLTEVFGAEPLDLEAIYEEYCGYAERVRSWVGVTESLVRDAVLSNRRVLLEGAQGALLDPEFGTYPYVTSSSPMAWGGFSGAGLPPKSLSYVVAVFKAYCTRVGAGPFPTEIHGDLADFVRRQGGEGHQEFGTTTGRPRRVGWFDAVAGRYVVQLNSVDLLAITRLDVLDALDTLKIAVAYNVNGVPTEEFPASVDVLSKVEPIYEELPGWKTPTGTARSYDELPLQARKYLERISDLLGTPIGLVSSGPDRSQTILLRPSFWAR
jgi:adenylosuccinate synthase